MFIDGSAKKEKGGAGIVLRSPKQIEVLRAVQFDYAISNNKAEYEALLVSLQLAYNLCVVRLYVYRYSHLVVSQFKGLFEVKDERLLSYLRVARNITSRFEELEIFQIPRSENEIADSLAKFASTMPPVSGQVTMEVVAQPSISFNLSNQVHTLSESHSQTTPIQQYLKLGILLEDIKEAIRIQAQAARYALIGEDLYKQSFSGSYLRCVSRE